MDENQAQDAPIRDTRTERQKLRDSGLLPVYLRDSEGRVGLGWWDAKDYVEAQGFSVVSDFNPVQVRDQHQIHSYSEIGEDGLTRYYARGNGKGMWINDHLVEPSRHVSRSMGWVYPIEVLDAVMSTIGRNSDAD